MEVLFQIINPVIYFIGLIAFLFILHILYKLVKKLDNMLNGKLSTIYTSWRNMSKVKKKVSYLLIGALLFGYLCYDMIYLPNKYYKFAIYEVQSMGGNTLESVTLSYKPFLTEDDIKSYDWNNHTFELKKHIKNYSSELKKLGNNNRAFVLVVNKERIYIGGFYKGGPNIYLTMDNKKGSLFYTGAMGYDTRSDERIYEVLKSCGKL